MAFKKKNNDNVNFGNPNLQNGMQNMQNNMQNNSMGAPKVKKERLQNVSKYSRTHSRYARWDGIQFHGEMGTPFPKLYHDGVYLRIAK